MSSKEQKASIEGASPDFESIYHPENIQGEIVTDVPGRTARIARRILRTKDDLITEIRENPAISEYVRRVHADDFYVVAHAVVDKVIFTVQKHKLPVIGITAAAIAAGAVYYELTREDHTTAQEEREDVV